MRQSGGIAAGRDRKGRFARAATVGLLVVAAIVLGIGQLVIPPLAEEAVREALRPYGPVAKVRIEATPALTLLWGDAELVEAGSPELNVPTARLQSLAGKASGVERGRLSVGTLRFVFSSPLSGSVTFHNATLERDEGLLRASGTISTGDVRLQLPGGLKVVGVRASEGLPELLVGAELGPLGFAIGGVAAAQEGRVVARPAGLGFFGRLAEVTLYSSPRIYVEAIEAREAGESVTVQITARER